MDRQARRKTGLARDNGETIDRATLARRCYSMRMRVRGARAARTRVYRALGCAAHRGAEHHQQNNSKRVAAALIVAAYNAAHASLSRRARAHQTRDIT